MNKKGISVVSLSVTIVILLVILSTISVSITYSVANAKKLTFAKEIYNIQSLVTEYIQKENVLPATISTVQIEPSNLEQLKEQFENEKITDGKMLLNVLDLTQLDIVNTNYGNKKIGETDQEKEKDIYAVSAETGRVYYIAGFKDNNKTHYTLTDDLLKMIEKKQDLLISEKTIIFTPSKLGWSNEAISVRVTVPETYEITNFGINNENIKYTEETVDNVKIYNVNLDKVLENYEISVTYTKNEVQGNVKYKTKIDLTTPVILKDENITNTTSAIKGLNATDEESGIKYFKYAEGIINDANAKEYVTSYGKNVNKGSIKMKNKSVYTLYAEDKAGNYSVLHLDGDGERFYPTVVTATGSDEIVVSNSYNLSILNYRIYGNSVQNGTPTPDTPVEIESVGELIADEADVNYGKYKIPITVSGKNLFDKTKNNLTDGYHLDSSTGMPVSYTARKRCTILNPIDVEDYENVTVTYSADNAWFMYSLLDSNNNLIIRTNQKQSGYSIDVSSAKYLYICFYDVSVEMIQDIQVEAGTTATSYEPYVEQITKNIYLDEPLRKVGDYKDYIDFQNQKVVRNIGVKTFDGTENINSYEYGLYYYIIHAKAGALSSHFEYLSSELAGSNKFSTNINTDAIHFFVNDTTETFKSWLAKQYSAGTPLKVNYVLTTSTEEKINVPEINLNYGTNNIIVDTTIAPSQTDITYYKKQY